MTKKEWKEIAEKATNRLVKVSKKKDICQEQLVYAILCIIALIIFVIKLW